MLQRIYTIGKQGKYIFLTKGVDILRPARLKEVVPGIEVFYMHPPEDNKFFLMSIPKETEYKMVKGLVESNYVWIKNEKYVGKKESQQGTQLRAQGT